MSVGSHLHSSKLSPSPTDLGIYVHVPYCLQKCHYCDFVKFKVDELPPYEDYFRLVLLELKQLQLKKSQKVQTLYFGGGTPSLAPKSELLKLIEALKPHLDSDAEVTLEINPGTLSEEEYKELSSIGFNRFSLGVQTFKNKYLKACGRLHTKEESFKDLEILNKLDLNHSIDLLFGLPHQTLEELIDDLKIIQEFKPKHVSPYNLTLPENHFFNSDRAPDDIQIEMMNMIAEYLSSFNCHRYEISNFGQKGYESRHNQIYWNDQSYYGLGMGAHSYVKEALPWGLRYWNPGTFSQYQKTLQTSEAKNYRQEEVLKLHESLTDFCHTSLRQSRGLSKKRLIQKYSLQNLPNSLWNELLRLEKVGLLDYNSEKDKETWFLTEKGFKIPNEIFRALCFLERDMNYEY